jgi:hypothetical protein
MKRREEMKKPKGREERKRKRRNNQLQPYKRQLITSIIYISWIL